MTSSRRHRARPRRSVKPEPGPSRKQKILAWVIIILFLGMSGSTLIMHFAQ